MMVLAISASQQVPNLTFELLLLIDECAHFVVDRRIDRVKAD
jgi:hypothetical protein